MSTALIHRPTEAAALGAATRSSRPLPPLPHLFASLVTATRLDDQHGMNLFAHAIARHGGELGE